jgi:N-acetylglucosaminyldiphosphoundecaprenol N-acetyl-beta-D-mannosaminyltransferase
VEGLGEQRTAPLPESGHVGGAAGCSCASWAAEGPEVCGVRFALLSPEALVAQVDRFRSCGAGHVVHFCAAHPLTVARSDPAYLDVLNRGLNVADGMGVVLALRLLGYRAQRLTGTDALALLCERSVHGGLRHYLFGGAPDTVEKLGRNLRRLSPGVRIVGAESPPFRALEETELGEAAARIRGAGTDVLWIGLGAPKQDRVAEMLREQGSAPAILCVGAAFDFLSGAKRRAPRWMQRSGLEWLHRLASEPARLWRRYLIGNVVFLGAVLVDYARSGRR